MTGFDPVPALRAAGLAPGALVLDVGCGTGLPARAMARAGYRVIGVDADVDAVATGRGLSAGLPGAASPAWLAARGERLPFRDAAFAAVLCGDVLHWAADEAACRALWHEAWRVLEPGGAFHVRCVVRDEHAAAEGSAARRPGPWFPVPRSLLDRLVADGAGRHASPPRRDGDRLEFTARKPG